MSHIRKQILILDNNNPSKYKLQFLNDDVIYLEGKKPTQTHLALCEKKKLFLVSTCKLSLISQPTPRLNTARPVESRKYLN